MRTVFVLCYVANLFLALVSLLLCPSTVAIHFGSGGEPNGWAPAHIHALATAGVNTLLFLSLAFAPRLIRKTPAQWINLPNKNYWLKAENRSAAESLLSGQLDLFGSATFALLFATGLLALHANLSAPIRFREDLFWWPFSLFMAFMACWTIRLFATFRVPKRPLTT